MSVGTALRRDLEQLVQDHLHTCLAIATADGPSAASTGSTSRRGDAARAGSSSSGNGSSHGANYEGNSASTDLGIVDDGGGTTAGASNGEREREAVEMEFIQEGGHRDGGEEMDDMSFPPSLLEDGAGDWHVVEPHADVEGDNSDGSYDASEEDYQQQRQLMALYAIREDGLDGTDTDGEGEEDDGTFTDLHDALQLHGHDEAARLTVAGESVGAANSPPIEGSDIHSPSTPSVTNAVTMPSAASSTAEEGSGRGTTDRLLLEGDSSSEAASEGNRTPVSSGLHSQNEQPGSPQQQQQRPMVHPHGSARVNVSRAEHASVVVTEERGSPGGDSAGATAGASSPYAEPVSTALSSPTGSTGSSGSLSSSSGGSSGGSDGPGRSARRQARQHHLRLQQQLRRMEDERRSELQMLNDARPVTASPSRRRIRVSE